MRAINGALAVIAVVSILALFGSILYILIHIGFPWWITVGPVLVFGLVAWGFILKAVKQNRAKVSAKQKGGPAVAGP